MWPGLTILLGDILQSQSSLQKIQNVSVAILYSSVNWNVMAVRVKTLSFHDKAIRLNFATPCALIFFFNEKHYI